MRRARIVCAYLLFALLASASRAVGPAYRVKDINTSEPVIRDSFVHGFTPMDDQLYFFAYNGTHEELWRTDGTTTGTVLVRDFPATTDGPLEIYDAIVSGSRLYFLMGASAWVSDGTTAGTIRLARTPSVGFYELTEFNGHVYFVGWTNATGYELWRTDGTKEGTGLFADLWPGYYGSEPLSMTVVGSELYFMAKVSNAFEDTDELFRTDGTQVVQITSHSLGWNPRSFAAFQDKLYFVAGSSGNRELWVSDGTTQGTTELVEIDPTPDGGFTWDTRFVEWNGHLYFYATDGVHGFELWRTDGSAGGTEMVADLLSGSESSYPCHLTAGADGLYLTARFTPLPGGEFWLACSEAEWDPDRKLYVTGGTAATTTSLGTNVPFVEPGYEEVDQKRLTELDGVMYFGTIDSELWRSDGTPAGTWRVADWDTPDEVYAGRPIETFSGQVWFRAYDTAAGLELWASDGITASLVKNLVADGTDSAPEFVTAIGDSLLFTADDGVNGRSLWISDGTEAGTMSVQPIDAGEGVEFDGAGYFAGSPSSCLADLWKSDGTPGGTEELLENSWNCTAPTQFLALETQLLFTGQTATGRDLWSTDGTTGGTEVVKFINPGGGSTPWWLAEYDGEAYFSAYEGTHGRELWKSDGTEAGTTLVADIKSGSSSSNPSRLLAHDDLLYFVTNHTELSRSDGTQAGTELIWTAPFSIDALWGYENDVLFTRSSPSGGRELWASDGTGTGTRRLAEFLNGTSQIRPSLLGQVGARFCFVADDWERGDELWVTDGTPAGTTLLREISTAADSFLNGWTWFADSELGARGVLFAIDDVHGMEPWVTDGTADGTYLLQDIAPGPVSAIGPFIEVLRAGDRVYFIADDGISGRELWAMPLFAPGAVPDGSTPGEAALRVGKTETAEIELSWSASSCPAGTRDYAIYEGTLGDPSSAASSECSTSGLTSTTIQPGAGNRFFLVVARNESTEGSYGLRNDGSQRDPSASACAFQWLDSACE